MFYNESSTLKIRKFFANLKFLQYRFASVLVEIGYKTIESWFTTYAEFLRISRKNQCIRNGLFHSVEKQFFCHSNFYVKSIFAYWRRSKSVIFTISKALDIDFVEIVLFFKPEFYKNQNFSAYKTVKITLFETLNLSKTDLT